MSRLDLTAAHIDPAHALHIGDQPQKGNGQELFVHSPIDGSPLSKIQQVTPEQTVQAITAAHEAFLTWRSVPAPVRGQLVYEVGQVVRERKAAIAAVITAEVGKITAEALGEVQEWIDICDFAVGLSRQLHGLTIATERPGHRMMEQWHPLGVIGVISAFNFPVAVWAWNAMLGLVCGDTVVWKPSEKAPLCALATQAAFQEAVNRAPAAKGLALSSVVIGGAEVGQALAADGRVPLVSATGSVAMGKKVGAVVGGRLGKSLLELGGNNAMILTPTADLDLAIRAVVFSAVGTAGQRCTTLRRLIIHKSLAGSFVARLKEAYSKLPIGDPSAAGTLVGPLIDKASFEGMQKSLAQAKAEGGMVFGGEQVAPVAGGFYVRPAIVEMPRQSAVVQHETFAPILYVLIYETLEQAIALNNDVPQGLSSAIFTGDIRQAEQFLSAAGSDCGIANVNIGTSGAEIGGAFGGEKETGGGRESGSDSWRAYMRRTTNTINYGDALPLAQGIRFDL